MRSGSQRENPRHFAAGDRAGHPAEAGGSARRRAEPRPQHQPEPELQEAPPPVRVQRSRLAIAVAVTVAAVPILVLDNLPATAETGHGVETVGEAPTTEMSIVLLEPSTTTTIAAPTTEATPTTTAAPMATEQAPATTERAVLQAAKAPTPTTARPTTTTAPSPKSTILGDPSNPASWDALAQCEAGGNWAMSSGNGYYGGLQFSVATWQDVGGTGYPHQASRTEQIKRGQILQARSGWGAWPSCARKLGFS